MLTATQSDFHQFVPAAQGRRGSTIPRSIWDCGCYGRTKPLKDPSNVSPQEIRLTRHHEKNNKWCWKNCSEWRH